MCHELEPTSYWRGQRYGKHLILVDVWDWGYLALMRPHDHDLFDFSLSHLKLKCNTSSDAGLYLFILVPNLIKIHPCMWKLMCGHNIVMDGLTERAILISTL